MATALVNIPAVSMQIAHSLKAFYCPQHKVHLCNDHAVLISFLICHTFQVNYLGRVEMLTNRDVNKFVQNI